MTLNLHQLSLTRKDGEIESLSFGPVGTALVGPRNSSKTTSLRIIDFCLGDSDSAEAALGAPIVEGYLGFALSFSISGEEHVLERAVDRSFGFLTKIKVDGDPIEPRDFQRWLMEQLGWPELLIPRGRYPRSATEQVPLTFRSLFRHIYRKENSWLELASHEEEFLRQAVVSFFLGLAEGRYAPAEFEAGEASRRVLTLEERLRDVTEEAESLIAQVARGAGLSVSGRLDLPPLIAELEQRYLEVESRRQELLTTAESSPSFVSEPGDRYVELDRNLQATGIRVQDLSATVQAYEEALDEIHSQAERLRRAQASIGLFSEVPVTSCPACEQGIQAPASDVTPSTCYVCGQTVASDVRDRRIALELAALEREQSEVVETKRRTETELEEVRVEETEWVNERELLRTQLDQQRADLIAPYLTELEQVNREAGAITQQIATAQGLGSILSRRERTEQELAAARQDRLRAEQAVQQLEASRQLSGERCSMFSSRLTRFLSDLTTEPWLFGDVTLADGDMAFYVGTRRWETALGAEAKNLFLLAYHASLLELAPNAAEGEVRGPSLAILDNPMQQGVDPRLITEALNQLLAIAEENGAQILITLPQELQLRGAVDIIRMDRSYSEPDPY